MLKRTEELLRLNDILIGEKRIYDESGNKLKTLEVLNILSPPGAEDDPSGARKRLKIGDIISNLTKKYLVKRNVEVQTVNQEGMQILFYLRVFIVVSLCWKKLD